MNASRVSRSDEDKKFRGEAVEAARLIAARDSSILRILETKDVGVYFQTFSKFELTSEQFENSYKEIWHFRKMYEPF